MKLKIILFSLKLVRIIITIITLSITAKYFGSNSIRDNWLIAYSVFIVIDLAVWGPINETFRAKFIEIKNKTNTQDALNGAWSLFSFINIGTLVLSILLLLFSDNISLWLLPNYSLDDQKELALMIMLISPSLILNQVNLFLTSVLNAFNVFYVPEISGIISVIFNVFFIIFLVDYIGIYSLFVGHYFSLVLLLIMLLIQFSRNKITFFNKKILIDFKSIKVYVFFAIPFFLPYFFGQIGTLVEKFIAALISEGTVSNLDYSKKFLDIPVNVITSVMTTLYIPIATGFYFKDDLINFRKEFYKILKFGAFITISVSVFLILFASEIVAILYDKGSISSDNLILIKKTIEMYALGSMPIFLYSFLGLSLIASNNSKVYAYCGMLTQIGIIFFNLILYKELDIFIFPVSLLTFHLLSALFMLFYLSKKQVILDKFNVIKFIVLYALIIAFYIIIKDYLTETDAYTLFKKAILFIAPIVTLMYFLFKEEIVIFFKKDK